jgi:hypothetical protein
MAACLGCVAMPLLILLPLLVLCLVALWLVSLPVLLWARYRNGRARRRAQGWVIRVNAWLLAASVPMMLLGAWVSSHWFANALMQAVAGLLLGVLAGIVSLWLTRFEFDAGGFHYTPNRWVVLGLTALVAARVVVGIVLGWQRMRGSDAAALTLLEGGGLLAIAGLLLGYALAYTWGLRARLPRRVAASRSVA